MSELLHIVVVFIRHVMTEKRKRKGYVFYKRGLCKIWHVNIKIHFILQALRPVIF
jgi:hypothetical protein